MSLWDLKAKEIGLITEVNPTHPQAERLKSYGFTTGQNAMFLYRTSINGPRVYLLEDTVYSLSFELASQIRVKKIVP